MEKASDIIADSLSEITVYGAELSPESSDNKTAMRYLNRMMFALDAKGVKLGFTELTSLGSDVTVPAGANEGIVVLLAAKLWRQYNDDDAPLPMDLAERAREAIKTLYHIGVNIGPAEYPDTLPMGSGNTADTSQRFYEDLESTILAETGGSIGLEGSTP